MAWTKQLSCKADSCIAKLVSLLACGVTKIAITWPKLQQNRLLSEGGFDFGLLGNAMLCRVLHAK